MALRASPGLLRAIQSRVARMAVGPSTVRGRPEGTAESARRFLRHVPLRRFAVSENRRFTSELDRTTRELLSALPAGARQWGLARKVLNIYLRDCAYSAHLRGAFRLGLAERYCELPLDSITAAQLLKVSGGMPLPRWRGIGALVPDVSAQYQAAATKIARRLRVRRVHLDVFWWSADRDV